MNIRRFTHKDVLKILPDRCLNGHKGDYGRILLICGSRGYTGAAALAAMGALRSGAGLVYLGVPECIYNIEAVKLTEPIVFPLPDEDGMLSFNAAEKLMPILDKMDAVLMGPGLGRSEGVRSVLLNVLQEYSGPVILDADGINEICQHKHVLRGRRYPTILTPHLGEFQRLGGNIAGERMQAALDMAAELNSVVLLKGHESIITDGQTVYINTTGNPGMAVGGCGDVLAGIVASFVGQGLPPLIATACAAFAHGMAGDVCAEEIGQYGMLPTDILNVLPRLLK